MLNRVKHLVSEQSSVNNSSTCTLSTRISYNFQLSTYFSLLKTYYFEKVTKATPFHSFANMLILKSANQSVKEL